MTTDVKTLVVERNTLEVDPWEEIDTSNDLLLAKGVKAPTGAGDLLLVDANAGSKTLTQLTADEKAKVSSNDTTPGYLNGKLVAGSNITLTENNDGGNETLTIAATGGASDEKVKVSSNDTTPDYLLNKLIGTSGKITLTEVNDGSDEDLRITAGADLFDKTSDTTSNITEGTKLFYTDERVDDRVAALLVAGTGISLSYNDGANTLTVTNTVTDTDQKAKVSANDTTQDYLLNKIIGTSGKITVTEVNDGGDEDLRIGIGTDVFDKTANTTDNITEGSTNLFFTNERVDDRVDALIVAGIALVKTYNDAGNTYTLDVDIPELTADTTPDTTNDLLLSYDASASAHKKVTMRNVIDQEPHVRTWSFAGGQDNIGGGTTVVDMAFGPTSNITGIAMLRNAEIVGFSLHLNAARTSGSLVAAMTVNGVLQNGAGQTLTIDATNTTNNALVFATPISVSALDVVGIRTTSSSLAPSGADATVAFWGRDR